MHARKKSGSWAAALHMAARNLRSLIVSIAGGEAAQNFANAGEKSYRP